MLQCPQCTKPLRDLPRRCPTCQADLDLLVDYVSHLKGGLQRAEEFVRAGELGRAMWAYLEVLEVDPDNATARRQVGQVATAVRQFDLVKPGRRWANNLPQLPPTQPVMPIWAWVLIAVGSALIALVAGWFAHDVDWSIFQLPEGEPAPVQQPAQPLGAAGA